MQPKHHFLIGAGLVTLLAAPGAGQYALDRTVAAQAKAAVQAPRFEVDPMWPKPLPNHWLLGATVGVSVDANDHILVIHRQGSLEPKETYLKSNPPEAECCAPAPPVLEFNEAGDL